MATTEAQKKAVTKYDAENTKQVKMKLNLKSDQDILTRLEEVGSMQGFIKDLIRKEIDTHYRLHWVGGDKDGYLIKTFDTDWDAMQYGKKYYSEHEDEFDPVCGGLMIIGPGGEDVDWPA